MKSRRNLADQLKGATRLAVEATHGITSLVETMHHTIGGGPALLGQPWGAVTRLLTAPTYGAIRGVAGMVGCGLERVVSECEPLLSSPGAERGVFLAALNGVLGDYLVETNNPLAIEMSLCHRGEPMTLTRETMQKTLPPGGRLLILLHGSCLDEGSWFRKNHDHGLSLAAELDLIPIHLRYNSGLHISQNGLAFAILLERLQEAWPGTLEDIFFVGHSMGGLIARSACFAAEAKGFVWRQKLRALVTLGTPHHGAPMERLGNWVDTLLGISRYSAPLAQLGKIRSAGVTDLRYGNILDGHWQDRDRFARGGDPRSAMRLPVDVACFAIAASRSLDASKTLSGDGMVPVASALGHHRNPEFDLAFAADRQWVALGTSHLGLLSSPAVYRQLRDWLKMVRAGFKENLPS